MLPISYSGASEASGAAGRKEKVGGGRVGLNTQVTGGQLVLLHIHLCLFFISCFQKKSHSYKQAASSIIEFFCLNKKKKKSSTFFFDG